MSTQPAGDVRKVSKRGCLLGCLAVPTLFALAIVIGYAARGRWLPAIGYALAVPSHLTHVDVIVVLGGGNGDRAMYASQLYRQGFATHVIATGAPIGTNTGAVDLMNRGIPQNVIALANGSQNTYQDAQLSRQLMEEHHWHSALLVTDPYHIRRSLWTFRTVFAGTGTTIYPAPVVGGWFHASHWWTSEQGFVTVNDEYLKLFYYVLRGHISPAAIMGR